MMKTVVGIVCLAAVCLSVTPTVDGGYCSAYCDVDGYYQSAYYCTNPPNYYCCGSLNQRYCCSNSSQDITGVYPDDIYWCENSSWWIFNWRVITVLLTTTLVILLCSAFCCKCCYRAEARRSSDEIITISDHVGENGEGPPPHAVVFNPESPYAFTPPDYSSLPKDPPKYYDLYAQQAAQGHCNHAYMVTDAQEAEMVPVSSEAARNDDTVPGVHGDENRNGQPEESNQMPDDPPPYSEAENTVPTADATETVPVETESSTEV